MQSQVSQSSTQIIPIEAIFVQENFNPRRHFSEGDFTRLVNSIRDNGLITPICVRRREDGQFSLVAGERRFRAMKLLKETDVPALVVDCDDDAARRLALLENTDRANLSVSEEAYAAQKHIDAFDGDHHAAAASIGWSVSKLKCRLALLHCSSAVLDALTTDAIALGHAELLAGLPANQQDVLLGRVIDGKVSVSVLKDQLEAFSISLGQAFFDTADCTGCPHNSSQADLFAEKISSNRCTNKSCFQEKTKVALDAKKLALADDYATLAFQTEKVEGSVIPLVMHGANGVGTAQMAACTGCAFRGGIIEDRIGANTGMVTGPLCFQRSCHSDKLAAHQKAQTPAPVAATPSTTATFIDTKPKPVAPAPATNKLPNAVTIQYDRIVRSAVQASIGAKPQWALAMAVYGQAMLLGALRGDQHQDINGALGGLGFKVSRSHNKAKLIAELAVSDINLLKTALVKIPAMLLQQDADNASLYDNLSRREMNARIAVAEKLDLTAYVQIDAAYLTAFTKAGIETELEASGFKAWMLAKDEGIKAYSGLLAMKKDDLVKAVLAAGFDFTGYLPAGIKQQISVCVSGKN